MDVKVCWHDSLAGPSLGDGRFDAAAGWQERQESVTTIAPAIILTGIVIALAILAHAELPECFRTLSVSD